jgi:K+-transporting ATPase ATPase B chain
MSATVTTPIAGPESDAEAPRRVSGGLLDPKQLLTGLPSAASKLDPRVMWHNPVMLIVELGALLTTVLAVIDPSVFGWSIAVWLWLTVLFANLSEAVAEGRGKAQAETLRRTKGQTVARRLVGWVPGREIDELGDEAVPATTWWWRRGRSFPATATSSMGSPAWTSQPSPASRRR